GRAGVRGRAAGAGRASAILNRRRGDPTMPLLKREENIDRPPAPFVVGMNRSGTTLLRMMLDSHPDLTIPPETHFVPDVIRACRRKGGKPEEVLAAMKS